jgi:hypothetical protein
MSRPKSLYRIRWEIDLEATSAKKAAKMALEIQRDPESIATVFDVAKRKNDSVMIGDLTFRTIDLNPQG